MDSPFVSDDGRFVLFSSPDSGHGDILRYDVSTSVTTQFVASTVFENSAIITANGKRVFFNREDGKSSLVYCVDIDGKNERQVTNGQIIDRIEETNPDGSKILIRRSPLTTGLGLSSGMYLVDTQTGKVTQCGIWATFGSDGQTLLFTPLDDETHTYSSELSLEKPKKLALGTACRVARKTNRITVQRGDESWLIDRETGREFLLGDGYARGFVGEDNYVLMVPLSQKAPLYLVDLGNQSHRIMSGTESGRNGWPRISNDCKFLAVRLEDGKSRAGSVHVIDIATLEDTKIWPKK